MQEMQSCPVCGGCVKRCRAVCEEMQSCPVCGGCVKFVWESACLQSNKSLDMLRVGFESFVYSVKPWLSTDDCSAVEGGGISGRPSLALVLSVYKRLRISKLHVTPWTRAVPSPSTRGRGACRPAWPWKRGNWTASGDPSAVWRGLRW